MYVSKTKSTKTTVYLPLACNLHRTVTLFAGRYTYIFLVGIHILETTVKNRLMQCHVKVLLNTDQYHHLVLKTETTNNSYRIKI